MKEMAQNRAGWNYAVNELSTYFEMTHFTRNENATRFNIKFRFRRFIALDLYFLHILCLKSKIYTS